MFTETAAFYDAIYRWKDYPAETEKILQAVAQYGRSDGKRLLDVACGTGQHLAHLQAHFQAEGLDLEPGLLDAARQRCPDLRFYQADMIDFDLGQQYDVLTCLFSSIGYVRTVENLNRALVSFARHICPGGVMLIEPWFAPGVLEEGRIFANFVDDPGLKITRMGMTTIAGTLSTLHFHYLIGRPGDIEYLTEKHVLGLFTHDETVSAFEQADLEVHHEVEGLTGRGLYIGVKN